MRKRLPGQPCPTRHRGKDPFEVKPPSHTCRRAVLPHPELEADSQRLECVAGGHAPSAVQSLPSEDATIPEGDPG